MDFSKHASDWDTESRIARAATIANEIMGSLESKHFGKAMEFGCGTGLITFALKEDITFDSVTLVDSSKGMIEVVEQKIEVSGAEHIDAICGDILDGGLAVPEALDMVYSSMVLHHIPNVAEVLGRLHGLMKTGAAIRLVDLDEEDGGFHADEVDFEGHDGFSHEMLHDIMQGIGFRDISIRTFFKGTKVKAGKEIEYSLFILSAVK